MKRHSADTVLLFSGLDPSGAAGVSAVIETINQSVLISLAVYFKNVRLIDNIEVMV